MGGMDLKFELCLKTLSIGWLALVLHSAHSAVCGVDLAHQRRVKWHLSYAFRHRAIMCNQQEAAYHKSIC